MSITNTAWFYKYRPLTIDQYVFENDNQKRMVERWIKNGKIDGNLLLYGPPGTGKTALAELLIKNLVKNRIDLNRVKSRSVTEIDQLEAWVQKRPVQSKTKIVYFEEFDKISSTAMDVLKDGLMEKYQDYTTFIATTNYIRKIPSPIQTRFTIKFNLTSSNVEGVTKRLSEILTNEGIKFNQDDLKTYVASNIHIGLRDLINNVQIAVEDGKIDFNQINITRSSEEEELIYNTIYILKVLLQINDVNTKKVILINPLQSEIQQQYARILEIVNLNKDIQYEMVLYEINEKLNFVPLKILTNTYINQISNVRFPNITFLSYLAECIKCVIDISV